MAKKRKSKVPKRGKNYGAAREFSRRGKPIGVPDEPEYSNVVEEYVADNSFLDFMVDPKFGKIGSVFKKELIASGVQEYSSTYLQENPEHSDGGYAAFSANPKNKHRWFRNAIYYAQNLTRCDKEGGTSVYLIPFRFHEGIHAIQHSKAAALHATFINPVAQVVLCPRDYVAMRDMMERDAYAKEAWLTHLLSKISRNFAAIVSKDSWVHFFNQCDADTALFITANHSLPSFPIEGPNLSDYYDQHPDKYSQALGVKNAYHTESMRRYIEDYSRYKRPNTVYARLGREDYVQLWSSLGVSTFGNQDFFERAMAGQPKYECGHYGLMDLQVKAQIRKMNKKLGIQNENNLPTLTEALKDIELTPESFLSLSRSQTKENPDISLDL